MVNPADGASFLAACMPPPDAPAYAGVVPSMSALSTSSNRRMRATRREGREKNREAAFRVVLRSVGEASTTLSSTSGGFIIYTEEGGREMHFRRMRHETTLTESPGLRSLYWRPPPHPMGVYQVEQPSRHKRLLFGPCHSLPSLSLEPRTTELRTTTYSYISSTYHTRQTQGRNYISYWYILFSPSRRRLTLVTLGLVMGVRRSIRLALRRVVLAHGHGRRVLFIFVGTDDFDSVLSTGVGRLRGRLAVR